MAENQSLLMRAAETLRKARFTSKRNFEVRFLKRLESQVHKSGDLVLARNTAVEMSHDRKHKPRYLGPYEVMKRTARGNYQLKELDGTPLIHIYAAFRVLPYISRNHAFMQNNDADDISEGETDNEGSDSGSESSDDSE